MPVTNIQKLSTLRKANSLLYRVAKLQADIELILTDPALAPDAATALTSAQATVTTTQDHMVTANAAQASSI